MVVFIDLLKGTNIKKSLNVYRVVKRWHNHNNTGGNFGINIYPTKEAMSIGGRSYEITGYHNKAGEVTSLTFAKLFQGNGIKIIRPDNFREETYQSVMIKINDYIKTGYLYQFG